MAKPLVSNDPNPKDVRFTHFGVLDDGSRSKGATVTSLIINGTILAVILILGAVVKSNPELAKQITQLTLPPEPPKEIPKPKPPPPPPPKPLPTPPKVMPEPKLKPLPVEPKPELKPVIVPTPKPIVAAPAPLKVNPPPAPKFVSLAAKPEAAHIANNDAHPSPVRLGNPEIKALNGPPVSTPVNLGGGMHGMPASNTGSGPRATTVSLGNGSPQGTDINGKSRGAVPVKGLSTGVPGGTGTAPYRGPTQVQLQQAPPPVVATNHPTIASTTTSTKPVVVFKPEPVYSAEAKSLHLEGNVTLHIRVLASGTTEVLGVVHGLGHGLDESAIAATRATRFKPALDGAGHPVDFETNVIVRFQMS